MLKSIAEKSALSVPHLVEGYQSIGNLIYFAESFPLQWIHKVVKGSALEAPPKSYMKRAIEEIQTLTHEDVERMRKGDYPLHVLNSPKPAQHLKRLPKLYWDSVKISWRRRNKKAKEFSEDAKDHLEDVPDYYRRNFHHQTDGYLSEDSADLYDHQVEILFRGTANLMRRMILWGLRDQAKIQSQGEGMKILEVACGKGTTTEMLAKTFPKAKIVSLDLSGPYLSAAKKNLARYPRLSFVQGDAAEMDFKDETFDAVVSVFLFHELPEDVRENVLKESLRVLKPGGYCGMVDSLQMDDTPELNFGLEVFPKEFHEPFYKNYVNRPMDEKFKVVGFKNINTRTGFVSKLVGGIKPEVKK